MKKLALIVGVLLLVCAATASLPYDLVNDVIDDGGTKMTSGGYVLRGSFGQPTIGKVSGAGYVAYIGFWHPYPTGPGIEEGFFTRSVPLVFNLSQNYPNPMTSSTTIKYSLAGDVKVDLAVYNSAGQRMGELVHGTQKAGHYNVKWNLEQVSEEHLPNGVYFLRMRAGDFTGTRKLVLLR